MGKMTDAATAGSVNIAKAGTYTITVKVGENSDLTYSIDLATRLLQSQRLAIPSACSLRMATTFLP